MFALVLLTCAACSTGTTSPTPTPATAIGSPSNEPTVEITYPVEGEPVRGTDVLVALTVRAFEITEARGEPRDGEGHLVYYLDVAELPAGKDATDIAEGAGRAEASSQTSHTWKDVTAGRHTLGAQLVRSDDSPLDPPVIDTLEIVVSG